MLRNYIASRLRGISRSKGRPRRVRPKFGSQLLQLEERCLMSRGVLNNTGVPIPKVQLDNKNLNVPLSTIIWNGGPRINPAGFEGLLAPDKKDPKLGTTSMKTLTITNFSNHYIYPFLRTQNNAPKGKDQPWDPQDKYDQEFREYIGYSQGVGANTKYFLGMPPHATIEIQVPLVLWNAGSLYLATDGQDLTATQGPTQGIFVYKNTAKISIAQPSASGSNWVLSSANYPHPNLPNLQEKPLIMFYNAAVPATVGDDAPSQLVEITYRDPYLANSLKIDNPSETEPEVSYDVSYVNALSAPVALEASNVPITTGSPRSNNLKYYRPNGDWGWNGATAGTEPFTALIRAFVENKKPADLGQYFGGKGWPRYYNPHPGNLVIPSGATLFAASPIDARGAKADPNGIFKSNYDQNQWMLSSGGGGAISARAGGLAVNDPKPKELHLLFTPAQKKEFAENYASMKASGQPINVTAITTTATYANVGTLINYTPTANGGTAFVNITTPLPTNVPFGFVFQRTGTDYAATAITNLWYSWAKYYVDEIARRFPNYSQTRQATLIYNKIGNTGPFLTNEIQFTPQTMPPNLAVGMTVTASDGILPKGATVLGIDTKNSVVSLSQIPSGPASDTKKLYTFTFGLPSSKALPQDPKYTTPYTLSFNNAQLPRDFRNGQKPVPDPLRFAGQVFEAMSVEATSTFQKSPYLPSTMDVVNNVIGFNATFPAGNQNGWYSEFKAQVRDIVKSILRGVVDFVAQPDQNYWYPDPATKVPGTYINGANKPAQFNVFNLDPYVWFAHSVVGLSGYGFSVDDDVANPIAKGPVDPKNNPSNEPFDIQLGFGGIKSPTGAQNPAKPLRNQEEWFPSTRFGKITTQVTVTTLNVPGNNPYNGQPVIKLFNSNPDKLKRDLAILRTLNQINVPAPPGQLGPIITAPSRPNLFRPGTQLTFFPTGIENADEAYILLSQRPNDNVNTPITVVLDATPPRPRVGLR